MTDDEQLLRQFARDGSEPAFSQLVTKHIDLIYAAALRVVNGDVHLAQDVTQTVFIYLARKARNLPGRVVLAGWLYRHTCYTAATALRGEQRRIAREQTALEMRELDEPQETRWERIAPYLDEGLNHLRPADRDALVLRFLKGQDLRALGAALGISEDAAQKRVSRALEKLRMVLDRQGVALTVAALASAMAAEAVTAAPAGLAVAVTVAAASAGSSTGTILALIRFMTGTKLKTSALCAIVMMSLATSWVLRNQARSQRREQNEALRLRSHQLAEVRADNERLAQRLSGAGDAVAKAPGEELSQLRAEAASLRRQTKDLASLREQHRQSQPTSPPAAKTPLEIGEMVSAKQDGAAAWMRAFITYAAQHQGRLPTRFEQAEPFWPNDVTKSSQATPDQFEILYHGSIDALTNRGAIVFRERKLWQHLNGKWDRFDAQANGTVQYGSVPDGTSDRDFSPWEMQNLVAESQ